MIPFRRLALLIPVLVAALTAAALALPATSEEQAPRTTAAPPPTVEAEPPPPPVIPAPPPEPEPEPRIRWQRSLAVGDPAAGRLIRGVRLPSEGAEFFTWDPVKRRSPNRWWRRYGTDRLVRMVLAVVREYAAAHPGAPRLGIGDLSRPRGGDFGPRFGYIGHASHQNGLDVDVYYPRADGRERAPEGRLPDQPGALPGPGRPLRGQGRRDHLRRPFDRPDRPGGPGAWRWSTTTTTCTSGFPERRLRGWGPRACGRSRPAGST